MKKIKGLISMLLVICMFIGMYPINAAANTKVTKPVSGNFYLIQHVNSKKYLDITDQSKANGARLQIWEKYPKRQNQVFRFEKVGNYWKITANHSGKAIEVRDSSKSNNAHVAQWDYAGIGCQLWSVISNKDGTVSFKNKNSKKYLDVAGNGKANGVKVVQYKSNGTTAQKFKLYRLDKTDYSSAVWKRSFNTSSISWTKFNYLNPVANYTNYERSGYYPTPGKKYLKKVEYIDADTVFNMIKQKGLNKSTRKQIQDVLKGEITEEWAANKLKSMGYDVPGVGIALGILETLATSQSDAEWNKFVKTAKSGKGIKKTTYVSIVKYSYYGPLSNGTTAWGKKYYVDEAYTFTYSVWDGKSGVSTPSGYSGKWEYVFK